MTERRVSPLCVVLLTWVNLAVLLVNLWLSSSHETSVMDTARTLAEHPGIIVQREAAVPGAAGSTERTPAEVGRTSALDDDEIERVVEAVFVEDRVRTRTSALRQAVERLEQRGELSTLTDASRSHIVALGRRVAVERARLERRLLAQDSISVAAWDREIETLDEHARADARRELQRIVSAAEAEQLLRFIVPMRQSTSPMR